MTAMLTDKTRTSFAPTASTFGMTLATPSSNTLRAGAAAAVTDHKDELGRWLKCRCIIHCEMGRGRCIACCVRHGGVDAV